MAQKDSVNPEERDHKKLGRKLRLFTISPLVGAGLPLLHPRGAAIRYELERYLWELHKQRGYGRVWTPHIAKEDLYATSGHLAKFGDEIFRVQGKEEKFFLKPMSCPHHMQLFSDSQFSYRDLPVRYFEPATVYRDEKSGQLAGLIRVRAITQDDGHIFCQQTQLKEEIGIMVDIIKKFYATVNLLHDYTVRLSTRGNDHSKYLGNDQAWSTAETALEDAAKSNNLAYTIGEGEAAFYGPKLDFIVKDSMGREWQLGTIQCDFNLPERFGLSFTNERGEQEQPIVIHRAIAGSLERFMGILIEHYGGAFPLWLAPVQVKIIPVGEKFLPYAKEVYAAFTTADIRVELDESNETLNKKIRAVKIEKVPSWIVVGQKETEQKMLTLEWRDQSEKQLSSPDDIIKELKKRLADRT